MVGPRAMSPCVLPRWRTDAVPPATPTAFCSPGLWQGAGVRPLSRSARPSRCNHALITALGKFTVWSRHRLCLTLTKLLITAGGGRGARARRQGGASGRGAKSGGVHVPPKIPSVGWPSAVSAPCLCCGGLGEDAEAGGGSWGGLRGVCVSPQGFLTLSAPKPGPWARGPSELGKGDGEERLEQERASQILGCRDFQPLPTPRVCRMDASALPGLQPRAADAHGDLRPSQSTHTAPKKTSFSHLKEQRFAVAVPTSVP